MTAVGDFDALIGPYHEALHALINGDPDGYKAMYSNGEDVTLANPFGGVARGRTEVEAKVEGAAASYRDGEIVGFETQAKLEGFSLRLTIPIESTRGRSSRPRFGAMRGSPASLDRSKGSGPRIAHGSPARGPA